MNILWRMRSLAVGTLAPLTLLTPPVLAQALAPEASPARLDPRELDKLSLEDLLNLEVMIASKTPERLTDAPASITAYAQEDLRALGLQTLGEVAGMTAGYGNYVMYGEEVLSTRGQKAGSFNNNKHLVYYDGIPINFARNGKAPIDEELPIAYASRVEFLRGPASALYGTGSFFGVINVVPGELDRDGIRSDLRMGLGTFSDEKRVTGNVLQSSSVGLLRLTAGAFTREASLLQVGTRPNPDNLMRDDLHTVFLNASYTLRETPLAGLTVAFLYMRKASGLGESWLESTLTSRANQLTWETILPYLKYERSLGQRLTLRSYLIWNAGRETGYWSPLSPDDLHGFSGTGDVFEAYSVRTDVVQGQGELEWKIFDEARLIGGLNVDTRQQAGAPTSYSRSLIGGRFDTPFSDDPTISAHSDRYTTLSAYSQLRWEFPVLKGLIATLGARDDFGYSPSQTFNQLSPRAGLVQRLTDSLSVKAFFASALRAPGIKEIGLNTESLRALQTKGEATDQVKPLVAETIQSLELGGSYVGSRASVVLVGFLNRTQNALNGVAYQDQNIFVNAKGTTQDYGYEVELKYSPIDDLRLFGSYSFAHATDPDGKDLEDVPAHSVRAGATYTLAAANVVTSVVLRYAGPWRVASAATPAPDGMLSVDANAIWSMTHHLDLELRVKNVLDRNDYYPKHGVPDVPTPGISAFLSLAVRL